MYSDEFRRAIEQVKLRAPIEDVVRERVPDLRKSGALWVARCPFHDEKTPSFKVDPRRGTWHCFGACGTGGDQIAFVERFDRVEFQDALEILAARAGVELPRRRGDRGEDRSEIDRLHGVLDRAAAFFRRQLATPEGARARAYLADRGLSQATCDAFGVGWAPASGTAWLTEARQAGVDLELSERTGLARRDELGRPHDFFRGRVTIPIRDSSGRTVGFGARRLTEDGPGGKYVNSPETALFHKGRLIYALDLALPAIRKSGHAVLVEGYTDVMAAHQVGLTNVVAVLGTATTEDHAGLIRRSGARRVSLVFDGDEAGRRAAFKALHGLLPLGVEIDVVRLIGGEDPCDVLVREGAAPLVAQLELARDWFEFLRDGVSGLKGIELSRAVDQVLELLARLHKPVHRDSLLGELARHLGLPVATLHEQMRGLAPVRAQRRAEAAPAAQPPPRTVDPREREAFEILVGSVLVDASLVPRVRPYASRCPDAELSEILAVVLELYADEDAEIGVSPVLDRLAGRPSSRRVVPVAEHAARADNGDLRNWVECQIRFLEKRPLASELEELLRAVHDIEAEASVQGGETAAARDARAIELASRARELLLRRAPQSPSLPH